MSEKRKALIETASRLFAQYGYHAVGIDRIIAESQVAKMTMYKYFPSKNKLVVEVLNTKSAELAADIATAVAPHSCPLEKLRAVFLWYDTWFRSDNFTGCMFTNAAAEFHAEENEILAAAAAQKDGFVRAIAHILDGILDAENAVKFARRCVALIDGATIAAQVGGRVDAALDAWDMASALIERERLETV
jgi:AcrR family transcriptional regulator